MTAPASSRGITGASSVFGLLLSAFLFPHLSHLLWLPGFLLTENWSVMDFELHLSAQMGFIMELFLAVLSEAQAPEPV